MNIREKLEIRMLVNLLVSVIERIVSILTKFVPKPKIDPPHHPKPNPLHPNHPDRPRPLKKVVDKIDEIIPLPWRNH